jgi:hypothetical protein
MIWDGVGPMLLAACPIACSTRGIVEVQPVSFASPPRAAPSPVSAPEIASPAPACAADEDCGYDPAQGLCRADPRANRQPPLVDQGLVCYCDGARCASLRVPPVPCESDASCAVSEDPRPHPIAADAIHPHERGGSSATKSPITNGTPNPCRDFVFSTTCERTNICTMHPPCPRR